MIKSVYIRKKSDRKCWNDMKSRFIALILIWMDWTLPRSDRLWIFDEKVQNFELEMKNVSRIKTTLYWEKTQLITTYKEDITVIHFHPETRHINTYIQHIVKIIKALGVLNKKNWAKQECFNIPSSTQAVLNKVSLKKWPAYSNQLTSFGSYKARIPQINIVYIILCTHRALTK